MASSSNNEYYVDIYDDSLARRLVPSWAELRLLASVILPGDRQPSGFGDAAYDESLPLPSDELRCPSKARCAVSWMLETASRTLGGVGIPVPLADLGYVRDWISSEAAGMAADAHLRGLGAAVTMHVKIYVPEPPGAVEAEDDSTLSQNFLDDGDNDDDDDVLDD